MGKKKILVVGDSCTDIYCYGKVERISPEAPVPIVKIERTEHKNGMASNVAENLRTLGNTVDLATNKKKPQKIRYVDSRSNYHMIRVDMDDHIDEKLSDSYHFANLKNYNAVVVSDYNKGFLTSAARDSLTKKCLEFNVPLFVDSKLQDLRIYEGAILKINESEWNNCKYFPDQSKTQIVITLGKSGAMLNDRVIKGREVAVFDVCGAGDSFLAGLVHFYLQNGKNLERAIERANIVGSIAVSKFGVYAVTLDDIAEVDKLDKLKSGDTK